MGDTAKGATGWAVGLALVCAALTASALAVLVVRADLLTGRAPAGTGTGAGADAPACTAPEVEPDLSPMTPGTALAAVHGSLPMLPLPGLGPVQTLGFRRYATPEDYALSTPPPLLVGRTRSAMLAAGLVQANTVGFEAGPTFFGAEAFQTASPAQAAELERRLLGGACEAGAAGSLRPIAGIPGGVVFAHRDAGFPPFRAMFVVGETVVQLNVCICADVTSDPYAVVANWARAIDAGMRAPRP